MTKKNGLLSLLTSKVALASTLALVAVVGLNTKVTAQEAVGSSGTFRTAVCDGSSPTPPPSPIVPLTPGTGGSHSHNSNSSGNNSTTDATTQATGDGVSATYVTLVGNQAAGGFGSTSTGAQLTNDGTGGIAGLNLRLSYPASDPSDNYNQLQLNYSTNGTGTVKNNTKLIFCFQTNNGLGDIVRVSIKLSDIKTTTTSNGFTRLTVGSVAGVPAGQAVLRKLSIQLGSNNKSNNDRITIGDVSITTNTGTFDPVGITLADAGCGSLSSCPSSNAAAAGD